MKNLSKDVCWIWTRIVNLIRKEGNANTTILLLNIEVYLFIIIWFKSLNTILVKSSMILLWLVFGYSHRNFLCLFNSFFRSLSLHETHQLSSRANSSTHNSLWVRLFLFSLYVVVVVVLFRSNPLEISDHFVIVVVVVAPLSISFSIHRSICLLFHLTFVHFLICIEFVLCYVYFSLFIFFLCL